MNSLVVKDSIQSKFIVFIVNLSDPKRKTDSLRNEVMPCQWHVWHTKKAWPLRSNICCAQANLSNPETTHICLLFNNAHTFEPGWLTANWGSVPQFLVMKITHYHWSEFLIREVEVSHLISRINMSGQSNNRIYTDQSWPSKPPLWQWNRYSA